VVAGGDQRSPATVMDREREGEKGLTENQKEKKRKEGKEEKVAGGGARGGAIGLGAAAGGAAAWSGRDKGRPPYCLGTCTERERERGRE